MYKKLSPGLKAKIALEAFREEKTLILLPINK